MAEKISIKCPNCSSKNTIKKGTRKNKLQIIQKYQCKECNKFFTENQIKHTSYPAKIILNAISYYNLGHTQEQAAKLISQRYKIKAQRRTISEWVNIYKNVCTFSKLRPEAIKLYNPQNIIFSKTFHHIQPYTFKYHKAKLYLLFRSIKYNNQFHNISHFYEPTKQYLEKIPTEKFPHHIFTYNKNNSNESASSPNAAIANKIRFNNNPIKNNRLDNEKSLNAGIGASQNKIASCPDAAVANNNNVLINVKNKNLTSENKINENKNSNETIKSLNIGAGQQINDQRASQIKFEHLKIETKSKNNLACKLASLALNLAASNKERHQKIQDFMLINDSTTIATEVPIYLTNWDAGYYRNQNGFIFPLNSYTTPITGHIDILQIRNGLIHILDYKPDAGKIKPIEQLTIYAMALSRKLNLPLYFFKCAWFDENNYYEFFPLHTVYEKQK